MIVYDEMKNAINLKLWWDKMYQDVRHSYPISNFTQVDNTFKMKTAVDIGCNIGCFSDMAADSFEKVVSFEPGYYTSVVARTKVNQKNKKNNVHIHNLAVSKNTGDVLKLKCDVHNNSLNSGNSSVVYESSFEEYELVTTVSLEKVFELCEVNFIDYLKIDCEGSEYDILLGKDLSNIGIICGEIRSSPYQEFSLARKELLKHLSVNFNICARKHNFFATNKIFNIDPADYFTGEKL